MHSDLETAFLQGQSYGVNRVVVSQLPPAAGHPLYIAASLKRPAYGMNDAPPDAGGTSLTRHCVVMSWFLRKLIDAVMCCTLFQSCERTWKPSNSTHYHDAAFEKSLDPTAGSPASGKSVVGIINLFVDDLFGKGGTEMEQRVLARL